MELVNIIIYKDRWILLLNDMEVKFLPCKIVDLNMHRRIDP